MSGVSASGTAGIRMDAEVVKKSSHRYSPKITEPTHPYHEKGHLFMIVDVASGAAVKGFADEEACRLECERMNNT